MSNLFIVKAVFVSTNAGYPTIGGSVGSINTLGANQITAPVTGSAISLAAYIQYSPGTGHASYGIYSDSSNNPGILLARTNPGSVPTSYAWTTLNLITPVTLNSGTKYWIAILVDTVNLPIRYDNTSVNYQYVIAQPWNSGVLPSTWPTGGGSQTLSISLYVTIQH
jgi:hypothetical protein